MAEKLDYIAEQLRPLAVAIGSIDLDPANARKHPAESLSAVRGSLRSFGQRKPIVVNRRTGTVLAGNGTLTAARDLKWTHIAAVFVDDDPATAAGYAIADNRTAELSEWGQDELAALLEAVETGDSDLQTMLDDLAAEIGVGPGGEDDGGGPAEQGAESKYKEQYAVIVTCRDELHQQDVFESLKEAYGAESVKVVVT